MARTYVIFAYINVWCRYFEQRVKGILILEPHLVWNSADALKMLMLGTTQQGRWASAWGARRRSFVGSGKPTTPSKRCPTPLGRRTWGGRRRSVGALKVFYCDCFSRVGYANSSVVSTLVLLIWWKVKSIIVFYPCIFEAQIAVGVMKPRTTDNCFERSHRYVIAMYVCMDHAVRATRACIGSWYCLDVIHPSVRYKYCTTSQI